jgi:hypothetical protein
VGRDGDGSDGDSADEDVVYTGRAAHQAPEVDGECVLESGSAVSGGGVFAGGGPAVGDLVRAVVVGTDGADLLVSPRETIRCGELLPVGAGAAGSTTEGAG